MSASRVVVMTPKQSTEPAKVAASKRPTVVQFPTRMKPGLRDGFGAPMARRAA